MKKLILALLIAIMFIFGCSVSDDETTNKDMSDLNLNKDFNFETTREVTVDTEVLYNGTFTITDMEGNVLHKSLVKINSEEFTIELPIHIDQVVLMYDEVDHLEVVYQIENNHIEYSFVVEEPESVE